MVADEGRFGRLGEVKACWCPKGIRPIVAKQQLRQYTYAYAAVAPSHTMFLFLSREPFYNNFFASFIT